MIFKGAGDKVRANRTDAMAGGAPAGGRLGRTAIFAAALAFGACAVAAPAWAERIPDPAVALVSDGGIQADGTYRLGLEITLGPGWKTYWRQPGDSGIPPRFDFSGSGNVAAADIAFPAPERVSDPAGESIVYRDRVLFPLAVTPVDPAAPVRVLAEVSFGFCREVCIPATESAWAVLSPAAPADPAGAALIDAASAEVPVPESPGLLPRVVGMTAEEGGASYRIELEAESAVAPLDLFAEGPDETWRLPQPDLVSRDGATAVFRLAVGGVPAGADAAGAAVRLTLVGGEQAVEAVRTLD